ncbi:hypothetical protein L2E82_29489 [Cichorium intybus]|uniref:Uncharacterized protein n=1 Tax=Cichorium intybus TaxID=13427 RepID=A0ACB9CXR9_CICIN|nr:hypothetical protein L2E82_29489 [Cichorium intybus]
MSLSMAYNINPNKPFSVFSFIVLSLFPVLFSSSGKATSDRRLQQALATPTVSTGNSLSCRRLGSALFSSLPQAQHPLSATSASLVPVASIIAKQKDWESVARREKIELELRKLEGAVEVIHDNLLYHKGSCHM